MELDLDDIAIDLELWNEENRRAREEYYLSPGPHPAGVCRARGSAAVSPRFPTGPTRRALEQAMDGLWAAQNRIASQRRLITDLYRQIIDLETRVGDRDANGVLQDVQGGGADDGPEGDRVLLPDLRTEGAA